MYPLYWTKPVEGVLIMKYSYEFKRKCVELYRKGIWMETPEDVKQEEFHNKEWTAEERYELVAQVIAGKSNKEVALSNGINDGQLYQWVRKYKTLGYNGLVNMKRGRPSKESTMPKKIDTRPLSESEREELIRLREEIEYIKAENEVIKKEIALREEKEAARLKARKQRSSKNCVKKDIN